MEIKIFKKFHNEWKTIFNEVFTNIEYIAYFIIIPYAAVQFIILKETQNTFIKFVKICTGLFFIIPWIIISTIILSLLVLYKQFIIITLKFKLKTKFHGLIVGIDSVLTFYEEMDQNVCYAFFINSLKNEEEFLESLKTRINKEISSPKAHKKLNCVRKYFMGHLYFEQVIDIDANEIVKRISSKKLTHIELCNKVDSIFQTKAPRGNSFNWNIFWSKFDNNFEDSTINTYVVILRIHHSIGDAVSLYNITSNLLCKTNDAKDTYANAFNLKNGPSKPFTTKIENLFELLSEPKNYLLHPLKQGRGVYTFVTENGEISCLEKMKVIRKYVKGVSVLNIIATAYSAAISSYITSKKLEGSYVPNKALIVTPIKEKKDHFLKYYKNIVSDEVDNNFTYLPFFVPFRNDKEMDIEERFAIINDNINAVYNSCDYKIPYVIMKSYLELLPNVIAKHAKKVHSVGTIGMAPGGPKLNFFNGDELFNVMPFLPAIKVNGMALDMYSYANRFTFTISANSDNFSYQDLTCILNDTFSNIDLLYQRFKNK